MRRQGHRRVEELLSLLGIPQHLWSDVWIALQQNPPQTGVSIEAWIRTIAKRRTIDETRKTDRERKALSEYAKLAAARQRNTGSSMSKIEVAISLDKLTHMERAVVRLRCCEYSHAHIGELYGITEVNSRKIYARAILKLSTRYGE